MALRVTYLTASRSNPNVAGGVISSEGVTISGASAQSSATPANAMFVSIRNADATTTNFDYSSANPTALAAGTGTSADIGPGERIWLDAVAGFKVAGITAS